MTALHDAEWVAESEKQTIHIDRNAGRSQGGSEDG